MKRRVLQITAARFPPEIRVLKEARSLRDAGYESAVLCPPVPGQPADEMWNGIRILRPEVLGGAARPADKVLFHALYFSPAWRDALREAISGFEPHVLHVHDIWLARTVFRVAGEQKIVMDLHENMPAAVGEYVKAYRGAFKLFNQVFKPGPRVMRYERSVLRRSDLTLVTVQEAATRVLSNHPGLAPGRVAVVENLESAEFLDAGHVPSEAAAAGTSVLYVGGFGPHRGIDTLIRAMTYLKRWHVPVRLDLVGATKGSNYVRMLQDLIRELDIESHVTMTEWLPAESVPSLIRGATIGAVPHHSNPHTDTTIPHKLYQYMVMSTPVLVSTSGPLERTVRAAKAGMVFRAGDPHDCAEKIREMLRDPATLACFGANGHDYVTREGHNWEQESAPALLRAYDSLFERPSPVHE